MKNCAVIGANGFLGKVIVKSLIRDRFTVYGVYHNHSANIPDECIKTAISDFLNPGLDIDYIFFSAGSFSNSQSQLISLNCDLLRAILQIYGKSKIIYISTTNVYGFHTGIINENSSFNSPTLYGKAKLSGEFLVSTAENFAIIRLTYLYGNGLDNGSFLPNIISQGLVNKKIIINGKGLRQQDYLHVEDAAELCLRAMNYGFNEIFLGATGKSYSNIAVAEIIASHIENCVIEFQGKDNGVSAFFNPDATRVKLGWKPAVNFSNGIKDMIH